MVVRVRPAPGTHVKPGTAVTLVDGGGPIGSPVGSYGNEPFRAPNFIGRPASAAIGWANQHGLCWSIPHLPPVSSSTASDLYSAYRVTAQDPAPGRFGTNGSETGRGVNPIALRLTVTPRR
jgi:beta-lactam-binding protein with PASTA domain